MPDFRSRDGLDPAKDSALLLQRMGFFTLVVALPVAAMISRRAAVVLVPIAVALLVIAALLAEPERLARALRRRSVKATALALGIMTMWILLSTSWAPRGVGSLERASNILFALVLGLLAVASLPERARAANLNALAVGTGTATLVAALTQATGYGLGDAEEDVTVLVRGMVLIITLTGPLVAWLLWRGRTRGALALFTAVSICTILTADTVLVASLLAGAAAFAFVVTLRGQIAAMVAGACALITLLAPAFAWLGQLALGPALGADHPVVTGLRIWAEIIARAPVKLITGHGFEAVRAHAASGAMPLPPSILVVVWHELGVVGALSFAAALWFAIRAVMVLAPVMQAGAIAAYVAAFTCGILGLASFRAWWLMTLVAVVIITSAVARGQARTDRPAARFVRPAEAEQPAAARPVLPGPD
jgi:hypothetical protein